MGELFQQIFVDPLALAFMQRVMIAVIMVGAVCGIIGAYVVTRGMAFMGDALAHTILPGVAVAYINTNGSTVWVLVGGMVAGVISAVIISLLSRGNHLSEDTAIGIVFAGALALGIGIISSTDTFNTDLSHLLVGNILAVGNDDLLLMAGISLFVLIVIGLLYKEFLIISFDPTFTASGSGAEYAAARTAGDDRSHRAASRRDCFGSGNAGDSRSDGAVLHEAVAYADVRGRSHRHDRRHHWRISGVAFGNCHQRRHCDDADNAVHRHVLVRARRGLCVEGDKGSARRPNCGLTGRGRKLQFGGVTIGPVAQLGERYNRTVEVRGSNPLRSTTTFPNFAPFPTT
jgi:hypothetical protein